MEIDAIGEQSEAAIGALRRGLGDARIIGLYLYGSAVAGGLRPDSDLDLLVVTDRSLRPEEKARVVEGLLPISGSRDAAIDMATARGDHRGPSRKSARGATRRGWSSSTASGCAMRFSWA